MYMWSDMNTPIKMRYDKDNKNVNYILTNMKE